MKKITPLGYFGRFVGLVFAGAFVVSIFSLFFFDDREHSAKKFIQTQKEANAFLYAEVGEHWIIKNPDIFVYPSLGLKSGTTIGRIPQKSIVEILDSKAPAGSLYPKLQAWKKVTVFDSNGLPVSTGWINASMVTKSKVL